MQHALLTDEIIKLFYFTYNALGSGFLEKVYQNSFYIVLKKAGFHVEAQKKIDVWFLGHKVGEYYADLIINDTIIIELKAHGALLKEHECQLVNYLKATDKEVGLLLNFGIRPQVKRKVFSNELKPHLRNT